MASDAACYQDASRRRRYSDIESRRIWYATCRTLRFARRYGTITQIEVETKLIEFMIKFSSH